MSSELDVLQALGAVSEIESMEKTAIVRHLGKVAPFLKGLPGRAVGSVRELPGAAVDFIKGQPAAVKGMVGDWAAKGGVQRMGGRLAGSALGAGAGAGVGYATGDTPEERKRRAIGGAVLGGAAGLVPGQFMSRAGRQQAEKTLHRQIYGITGKVPMKVRTGYASQGAVEGQFGRLHQAQALGYDVGPNMQAAISRNIHNIPGFMKGLATKPIDTLRHGTMGFGTGGALLAGGITAYQLPEALQRTTESGRAENLGRLAGETIGYFGAAPVPIVGNAVLGTALGEAGGMIGKRFGEITGLGRASAPTSHGANFGLATSGNRAADAYRRRQAAAQDLTPEDVAEFRRRNR